MQFYSPNNNIKNQEVILRVDFNVPIKDNIITDHTRIDAVLPTINALLADYNKIIIISHLGRPKGKYNKKYSLEIVANYLSHKLGLDVPLIKNWHEKVIIKQNIVLFENLRFSSEEEFNDDNLAKILASYADIYINDAFSCSHRAHASIEAITKFLPSFGGLLLKYEVTQLTKLSITDDNRKMAIIAGSKISTKIALIESLILKMDIIFIAGAMANNFLKIRGYEVGSSLVENDHLDIVLTILSFASENNCEIILPIDVVIADELDTQENGVNIVDIENMPSNKKIFDIGTKTIQLVQDKMAKIDVVVWNGPVGVFEYPLFNKGTKKLAKYIAMQTKLNKLISIAGGGDTVAAIGNIGDEFTYLSLAGGAFLEWIEGRILPGLQNLYGFSN